MNLIVEKIKTKHTFHIPVMGISYTIDTPLKVSHYGIDSVISLGDDKLLEDMREMYCKKYGLNYTEISNKDEDYRAKRITAYLNLILKLSREKFQKLNSPQNGISEYKNHYYSLLPGDNNRTKHFRNGKAVGNGSIPENSVEEFRMGNIDVNIMTKVDKENYRDGKKLASEFNDAHAALRGFANSELNSSIVFSAGMNPKLYNYLGTLEKFFPDNSGELKKKVIIKVSDYRSALIQGKYLAKKGIWVSEFRIESGLNCGGHAFATNGYLLGPILAEFRDRRSELIEAMNEIYVKSLGTKEIKPPSDIFPTRVTVQGGVGTAEEHRFLLEHYKVDSVGWGTPFLLVPEVTTVDNYTLNKLTEAKEKDLYLSDISPLGVPFNSLRGNSKDIEKSELIDKGKPGSKCPKKYLISNNSFTEKKICTASRQYQFLKIKEIESEGLEPGARKAALDSVVEKSCLCVGLSTAALLVNKLETNGDGKGVSICPGPNMAYFSKVMSLKEITDHIYGRVNVISRTDRPHMFIKELELYIDFLKKKIADARDSVSAGTEKYLIEFVNNLKEGILYYQQLFENLSDVFIETKSEILKELKAGEKKLIKLKEEILSLITTSQKEVLLTD